MARLGLALIPPMPHEAAEIVVLRSEAIDMARRLGDEVTLFDTLRLAAYVFPETLPVEKRTAFYAEAIQLAERLGRMAHAVTLLFSRVNCCLEVGDIDDARRMVAHAEQVLAGFRQPQFHWRAPLMRAAVASLTGDFAAADADSREALRIARDNDLFEGLLLFGIARCAMAYNRGDDEGFGEFAELALDTQNRTGGSGPYHAILHATSYDAARTSDALDRGRGIPVQALPGSASLAWAALRVGLDDHALRLYRDGRDHFAKLTMHFSPSGTLGPSALLLGRLAALAGEPGVAEAHYQRSLAFCEKLTARPYVAQTQLAWAQLLADQGQLDAARTRADAAQRLAASLGMRRVAAEAEALIDAGGPKRAAPKAKVVGRPVPETSPAAQPRLQLGRRGELWSLSGTGPAILLKDSKGLGYLQVLVRDPGREVHVLDLIGSEHDGGDAGPLLDARAKQSYRARAEELREELEEATRHNDLGRIEQARAELESIGDELSRAVGLGGRDRRAASQAERARINVQRRLRDLIRRVDEQDAALARHLEHSLVTGVFCCYVPAWPAPA